MNGIASSNGTNVTAMPPIKKTLLVASALCSAALSTAQSLFYIDSITVSPAAPTTADPITITLHGSLTMSNAVVVSSSHSLLGFNVTLDAQINTPGAGVPASVPHVEAVPIGTLPGGDYWINLTDSVFFDSAPGSQHMFSVTGGGGWICDSLSIYFMQFGPSGNDSFTLQLLNTSSGQINDQCVYLFDENGDTLAMQDTTAFAFPIVPGVSGFGMDVLQSASIPTGTFTGTIEIWSDDCSLFQCSIPWTGSLCPPGPCTDLTLLVEPTASALFPFNVPWQLMDSNMNPLASGSLQVTGPGVLLSPDTFCLAPGSYTYVIGPVSAPDSSFSAAAFGEYFGSFAQLWHANDGSAQMLTFPLYSACADSASSVDEVAEPVGLIINAHADHLSVADPNGNSLGDLMLFSADGRLTKRVHTLSERAEIATNDLAQGVYLLYSGTSQRSWRVLLQ